MAKKTNEKAELNRRKNLAEARTEWNALTEGKEEWPEEEHQARFEALLKICLHTPVRK